MKMFRTAVATGAALFSVPFMALALDSPGTQSVTAASSAQAVAAQMVPANAELLHNIDAQKARTGQQVKVKLRTTAHLKNGQVLPSGTIITGEVVPTQAFPTSSSKLALNFNQAHLKNGKVVPIKATIVGIYGPSSSGFEGYPVTPGNQVPIEWTDRILEVEQVNALPHVDLHSNIASKDSGVLVSNKKNVKLNNGSEIQLAIAPQAS